MRSPTPLLLLAALTPGCVPPASDVTEPGTYQPPALPAVDAGPGEPLGCERDKDGVCLPGCEELFAPEDAGDGGAPPCHGR